MAHRASILSAQEILQFFKPLSILKRIVFSALARVFSRVMKTVPQIEILTLASDFASLQLC